MEKNVLRAIEGISVYPLISFGIFFLFFVTLLAYVLVVKPEFVNSMSALPLQADEADALGTPENGGAPC